MSRLVYEFELDILFQNSRLNSFNINHYASPI